MQKKMFDTIKKLKHANPWFNWINHSQIKNSNWVFHLSIFLFVRKHFPPSSKKGFLFENKKLLSIECFLYSCPSSCYPQVFQHWQPLSRPCPQVEVRLREQVLEAGVWPQDPLYLRLFLAFGPRKVSESLEPLASKTEVKVAATFTMARSGELRQSSVLFSENVESM